MRVASEGYLDIDPDFYKKLDNVNSTEELLEMLNNEEEEKEED